MRWTRSDAVRLVYSIALFDDTQRIIGRAHILGQAADRDTVDAGFSDGAHRIHIDASRGFEHRAAAIDVDGTSHVVQAEIVDQDGNGPGRQRLFQLGDGLDFDLDRYTL